MSEWSAGWTRPTSPYANTTAAKTKTFLTHWWGRSARSRASGFIVGSRGPRPAATFSVGRTRSWRLRTETVLVQRQLAQVFDLRVGADGQELFLLERARL